MHKRGQVTVFVILGILIIVALAVIFYLYGERLKLSLKQEEFDFSRVEVIKNYFESCIEKSGNEALALIGKQGGEIDPGFYKNWQGNKVSYLCYTTSYAACYNKKPFLLEFVQNEVNNYVKQQLISCTNDLQDVARSRGYIIQASTLNVNTQINPYNAIIEANYPITIKSGSATQIQLNDFSKIINIPLGRLIKVADDIVDMEINNPQGIVFYDGYMIRQNGEIEIQRHTIDDTEIYITRVRNNPYQFQFAIQNYVVPFP